MKNSCIVHPKREALIIIRKWQLEFCDGDKVAAALLSFFEYWHNHRLDSAEQDEKKNAVAKYHGEDGISINLLQFHKNEDLVNGIMGIGKKNSVIKARKFLVEKNVISEHRNPNPRYKFDNTTHYQFHPEIINHWLINIRPFKNKQRSVENKLPSFKNKQRSFKNKQTISETNKGIALEITKEIKNICEPIGSRPTEKNDFSKFESYSTNDLRILLAALQIENKDNFKIELIKTILEKRKRVSAEKEKDLFGKPTERKTSKGRASSSISEDQVIEVLDLFRSVTGKKILNTDTNKKGAKQVLKSSGGDMEMIKGVFEMKFYEWKDTKMEKYIRLKTFTAKSNFESYMDDYSNIKDDQFAKDRFKIQVQQDKKEFSKITGIAATDFDKEEKERQRIADLVSLGLSPDTF